MINTLIARFLHGSRRLLYVDENHLIEDYDELIHLIIVIHFAAALCSIVILKRQIRKSIYGKKRILKIVVH